MTLWFTRETARAVDRAAIDEFGLLGIVLMENAAQELFRRALIMLEQRTGPVVVACGPGNNGGDGYALARLLHNAGIEVTVVTTVPIEDTKGDAGLNAGVAERMGIEITVFEDADTQLIRQDAVLLVDAVLGTGVTSPVRGAARSVIEAINRHVAATLAVDVPSGLDCDTGDALGIAVRATATVTFVGMKSGFANPGSRAYTGDVTVGDIGAPRELVTRFGTRLGGF